ncbi:MAG: hypothetical protein K6G42_01850 [Lachnospiraceae bacterium]|nr:hypothetical protein [Lachnospiraceae bacterium]
MRLGICGILSNMRSGKAKSVDIVLLTAVIFYVAFSFITDNSQMIQEWGFLYGWPWKLYLVSIAIIRAFAIFSVINEKDRKRQILFGILVVLGFIAGGYAWNLIFLMIAMADRSMKLWLTTALGTGLTMFGYTIICSIMGWVSMYGQDGRFFAFGMVNRTNFAFAVLFFIITVSVIRQGRFRYYEYVILYIITIATYYHVYAKNAAACTLLFITMCLFGQLYDCLPLPAKKGLGSFFSALQKFFFDYSFILAGIVFWTAVHFRWVFREIQKTYDGIGSFAYRLDMGYEMLQKPVTLFGQTLHEYGGLVDKEYFVVDAFFARVPVTSGIIYFIVIMAILTYFMIKARRLNARTIYFAFMVMALFSISDTSHIDISYNFLIALPFATWDIGRDG